MKKLVVKVDLCDDKQRSKAMKAVCGFRGIRSLNLDTKDDKLTVSGEFDPIKVVNKLKKSWHTEIVSIGPGKADDGKKDEDKKNEDQITNLIRGYQGFCPTPLPYSYMSHMKIPEIVSYVKIPYASKPNQDLVCALENIEEGMMIIYLMNTKTSGIPLSQY